MSDLHLHLRLQGSLFGFAEPAVDVTFGELRRTHLDDHSWIDHAPGWLHGEQAVFDQLWHELTWSQRTVTMWERRLPEPRLTSWWTPTDGAEPLPVLAAARRILSAQYGESFDSIGFNCYRDGNDSVAWHGDRHRHTIDDPVVAIVSVGASRPFRLRPRGGGRPSGRDQRGRPSGRDQRGRPSGRHQRGRATSFDLGRGDLLVMGGACQHDWEHCVPKVARAEPRISITYRHGAC